ncbi:uncharacterized protein LOC123006250 [Tribolium madens]|uniref:uncharacterized protein LOC123006250 n=1 Tax=Tribolium madens TaxID=41895 RepID=UPI001CF72DA8|nr:uncharacterized protein LOC123006250 [Tribolium madens]XP_044256519.1 uncharacterized protein LOC123006250 [Tribolium madens]
MAIHKHVISVVTLVLVVQNSADDKFRYPNWKFHFLPGTAMGLFMAIAVPLDLPNKNAYLAYNFEANYPLPGNQTYFEYPPLIQRRIDRKLIYTALETKMESNGYPGRACLLRTICEAAQHSTQYANGILGDIIHFVFTPSTSNNTGLLSVYEEAEKQGSTQSDCRKYNKNCTVSFLDLISWIGHSV